MALYLAVIGGLVLLVFSGTQSQFSIPPTVRSPVVDAGTVVTGLFVLIEARLWLARARLRRRLHDLEGLLNFDQYQDPGWGIERWPLSLVLYCFFFAFWLDLAIWG